MYLVQKKLIVEFIGTFFLLLVVSLTGSPIAIGGVLTALVYMGGYVSGAHYNPAVTLGLCINKKISRPEALTYTVTQIIAAITASAAYRIIHGNVFIPAPATQTPFLTALLIETLFTFLLVTVILHVAASEKTKGNQYFGLAIGFTLMAGAFAGGAISGGAYNPAIGIGPQLFDVPHIAGHMTNIVLYFSGPFLGGGLAGMLYKYLAKK